MMILLREYVEGRADLFRGGGGGIWEQGTKRFWGKKYWRFLGTENIGVSWEQDILRFLREKGTLGFLRTGYIERSWEQRTLDILVNRVHWIKIQGNSELV